MAQEDYLGWVEITSNVPGAEIFIDDKTVGAVGKTPLSQNIKPGKHTFWITRRGLRRVQGGGRGDRRARPTTVKAQLKGAPVGKLNVIGLGIEDATIYIDGKVAVRARPVPQGGPAGRPHGHGVARPAIKPYSRRITIQAKTETTIKVSLAPTPSRSDAVIAYVLAAGFGGGGIYLGLQAQQVPRRAARRDRRRHAAAGQQRPAVPQGQGVRDRRGRDAS